jgi:hypothetical protein
VSPRPWGIASFDGEILSLAEPLRCGKLVGLGNGGGRN